MTAAKKNNSYCVEVPTNFEKDFLDELGESYQGSSEMVFDFSKCKYIDRAIYPLVHQFKAKLQKNQISFCSINVKEPILSTLKADGVSRIFNVNEEHSPAKKESKKTIDVEFISPFIQATTEILKVQANVEATAGKPFLKKSDENKEYAIIGVISLVSNVFDGSVALCFEEKVFLGICESMLGETFTEINSDIEDAAGELLNIIFGMAKAELNNKKNYQLQKAIPTVLRGSSVSIKQTVGPTLVLPFDTPLGDFRIEIEAAKS